MHLAAAAVVPTLLLLAATALAQVDPNGRSILFVRGADGSGGGASGGTAQQRTELLSDVFDDSTAPGNSGFGELRRLLQADGFAVAQWIESNGQLSQAQLLPHRVVVLGSNNRTYTAAEVQAFHSYIDAGGSALCISDAQWGPQWGTAALSDNQFLQRYGVQVYQDNGQVTAPARSEAGRFVLPDHPMLSGAAGIGGGDDVGSYEGEGVSLFRLGQGTAGYQPVPVVAATGYTVRLVTPDGSPGGWRSADASDAAAFVVERGSARIAGHFDRNTFFNQGGVGSELGRLDNRRLARNLFRYLAAPLASAAAVGSGCGPGVGPVLTATAPVLGTTLSVQATGASPGAVGVLLLAPGLCMAQPLSGGCVLYVPAPGLTTLVGATVAGNGTWQTLLPVPGGFALAGLPVAAQGLFVAAGGPLGVGALGNAVQLRLGHPR